MWQILCFLGNNCLISFLKSPETHLNPWTIVVSDGPDCEDHFKYLQHGLTTPRKHFIVILSKFFSEKRLILKNGPFRGGVFWEVSIIGIGKCRKSCGILIGSRTRNGFQYSSHIWPGFNRVEQCVARNTSHSAAKNQENGLFTFCLDYQQNFDTNHFCGWGCICFSTWRKTVYLFKAIKYRA